MKRIWAIFSRDMKSNFREFLLIYILLAPLLLALGFRFFIPGVDSNTGLTFALHENVGQEVIAEFGKYGQVELYDNIEEIKKRVQAIDEAPGIVRDNKYSYRVLLDGNETDNPYKMILASLEKKENDNVDIKFTDIGFELSPFASIGSASLLLISVVLSGMLIGLSIIEDKEANILSALNVTPMNRRDYIIGKSLVGLIFGIVHSLLIVYILGMTGINLGMVLTVAIVSSLVSLLFGFIIGVNNKNQMSAIATTKILFLPVSASVIGAVVLPQNLQFLLYWSPIYWSFKGFYDIILKQGSWSQLSIYSSWILMLTALILLVFKGKIEEGLS